MTASRSGLIIFCPHEVLCGIRETIATVESDNSIYRVIFDARNGICFLAYEHGPRAYAYRDPSRAIARDALPWHTVKANNP